MPRHIPVDLILHALVESLLELPEDHLRDLARAISAHCIDPRLVADQWCDGAGVAQSADWLVRRLMGASHHTPIPAQHVGAETRAMEVAIARRLADVGLALLVTQDAEDRAAASLLLDASCLVVGLERAQVDNNGLTATIASLREMRNAAVAENDHWHGWAKTIAGIPSSHNPHDETLRDAVEKRIIAAETAPRPAHESLVASLRAELDEARDCARREVVWVPKGKAAANAETERPQFKVGDRVATPHGPDGTITSVGAMARVTLDETSWVYDLANLQHIPPAKFKVGDMVVANDPHFDGRYLYVAVVNRNMIGVSLRPNEHHGFMFAADDLALAPTVLSPTA